MTAEDVLVHEAAHAVVAWELGVRVGAILVDLKRREGHTAFASDIAIGRFAPGSTAHRAAAERDMLVFHAGFMAQQRFHYDGTHGWYPLHDYIGIFRIAEMLESDFPLIDAWSTYIEDRARSMIEQPATWARIQALALDLARRAGTDGTTELDGEAIDRFLMQVRVPATDARLAYRRRQATGILVVLERDAARSHFTRAIKRAYRMLERKPCARR